MKTTESTESFNLMDIDYKDVELLKKHINPHGRILSSRRTNISTKNQRKIAEAIKRARFMALLPFIAR